MSFLLDCPNCGKRNVGEFSFGGEVKRRPSPEAGFDAWVDYVFMNDNVKGLQREWWYHAAGCRRWFQAERDTTNNVGHRSFWFEAQ